MCIVYNIIDKYPMNRIGNTLHFCTLARALRVRVDCGICAQLRFCPKCTKMAYLAMFVPAVLRDEGSYRHHSTASERTKNEAFQQCKLN